MSIFFAYCSYRFNGGVSSCHPRGRRKKRRYLIKSGLNYNSEFQKITPPKGCNYISPDTLRIILQKKIVRETNKTEFEELRVQLTLFRFLIFKSYFGLV